MVLYRGQNGEPHRKGMGHSILVRYSTQNSCPLPSQNMKNALGFKILGTEEIEKCITDREIL
jgi:hypothetical protein